MTNNPLYGQLLEMVLAERPELAQFADLFQSQPEEARTEDADARLRRLSATAKRLREELDDSQDLLDDLSRALGACHECWGEDNRCPACRGDGQPGFFKPDRQLFDQFILPAIRKVSWLEVREKFSQ